MASKKCSSIENKEGVRKSILRNPEIPLPNDQNKKITIHEKGTWKEVRQSHGISLHDPKINQLAEWRKRLNEIENYAAKEIKGMQDVSKNTQEFINRVVSSKLNFPSNQPIFKNLPNIESDKSQNVNRHIHKVVIRKKLDSKNDMQKLLNELVEAEYRNEEINKRINLSQPYTDEWLEINKKFKEPTFKMPKQKSETQIYLEQLRKDLYDYLFARDDYLSKQIKFNLDDEPNVRKKQKDCKCLSDFYSQHSMCS